MRKEKEEEEEIRRVWPFYVLSLNPSKRKKSSKTGNRCNQYKQPTVNGSAVTAGLIYHDPNESNRENSMTDTAELLVLVSMALPA